MVCHRNTTCSCVLSNSHAAGDRGCRSVNRCRGALYSERSGCFRRNLPSGFDCHVPSCIQNNVFFHFGCDILRLNHEIFDVQCHGFVVFLAEAKKRFTDLIMEVLSVHSLTALRRNSLIRPWASNNKACFCAVGKMQNQNHVVNFRHQIFKREQRDGACNCVVLILVNYADSSACVIYRGDFPDTNFVAVHSLLSFTLPWKPRQIPCCRRSHLLCSIRCRGNIFHLRHPDR
nr:MAG TPA: hypothetical protein [Caudoviricetes sp.]